MSQYIKILDQKRHILSKRNFLSCRFEHTDYPFIHSHNYWEIMYITNGVMLHQINGYTQTLERGTLCLIRPNDSHMVKKIDPNTTHINFIISVDIMMKLLDATDPELKKVLMRGEYLSLETSERAIEKYSSLALNIHSFNTEHPNYRLLLGQLLLQFMSEIIRYYLIPEENHLKTVPKTLIDLINKLNDEKNFDTPLRDLVETSNYSFVHMSRVFKTHMKMTIGQYFIVAKMNHARILLESSNLNILEICTRIGYNSISYFNDTFKKFFNTTPSEYRNNWQHWYNTFEDLN